MGLNAVVFKNVLRLKDELGEDGIRSVDESTGEVEPRVKISRDHILAIERRLGNVDEIFYLRERVAVILGGRPSLLMQCVLQSGSHAGDLIPISMISQLREEIENVRASSNDPRVNRLLEMLLDLAAAAERQMNPIVFV